MDQKPGTIEILLQNAEEFLQPLTATIEAGGLPIFFEGELGADISATIFDDPALTDDITQLQNAITNLLSLVDDLKTAIEQEDFAAILEKLPQALSQITAVAESVKNLIPAIKNAGGSLNEPLASQFADFAENLFVRITELLAVIYVDRNLVHIETLELLGIFDFENVTVGSGASSKVLIQEKLFLNRLIDLIQSPVNYLETLYSWGNPDFKAELFLQRLAAWMLINNIPTTFTPESGSQPASIDHPFFTISHYISGGTQGIAVVIKLPIPDGFSFTYPLSDLWSLEVDITGKIDGNFGFALTPPSTVSILTPSSVNAEIALSVSTTNDADKPVQILGLIDVGNIVAKKITTSCKFDYVAATNPADAGFNMTLELDLTGLQLTSGVPGDDGFLSSTVQQESIQSQFDLTLAWSLKQGFIIKGNGGLDIRLPMHLQLGPVTINNLVVGLTPNQGTFPISIGASITAQLGPLTLVIDSLGFKSIFSFPQSDGNLGPLNVDTGFRLPDGVGISVNSDLITGGGFLYLNPDKGEYAGAVELEFKDIFSLKAVGVIQTKMPDGSKGFSLLVIITAEFTPIQLGFGFTLNAVGGLLGLNRTTNVDVLKQGIKSNSLQNILFPTDIINNISNIISDIEQVFPPYEGHFIFGPMGIIGWGEPSIITLQIGILLEVPNPRILIPGIIKAFLPTADNAILKIQVNFVGIIDFDNKYISLDASLYDSSLFIYTLAGDMAFRLSWGDKPFFLLSVGGFHPAFKDAPPDLANMTRLTISLLSGDDPRITIQCYFAVTSNTVQFGAKAELYAGAGGFNVYGFIGYDCLFQFSPFHFDASFSAGLALRRGTDTIMGINLSGELSGPSPWDVQGDASISILFFSISVSFHETWGDAAPAVPPELADLISLLTTAIADDSNWKADLPSASNQHVSVKKLEGLPSPIVHPFGVLTFSERIVPLYIDITHYGNQLPKDAKYFEIKTTDAALTATIVQDEFAAANFFDLTDSEKLSRPSYERMTSGFAVTGSSTLQTPDVLNKDVDYRFSYLRKKKSSIVPAGQYTYPKTFFQSNRRAGAVSASVLSYVNNRISPNSPQAIRVNPEQYVVTNMSDMEIFDSTMMAGSYSEALAMIDQLVTTRPELIGSLQVVSVYDLNMN